MDFEQQKEKLIARLTENYNDYCGALLTYDRQEIIDKAREIATVSDVFSHLTMLQDFYGEEITHLLKFCNPLEVMCARFNEIAQRYDDYTFSEQMSMVKTENAADLKRYPLMTDSEPPAPLRKYVNVDVIASLQAIMGQVTVFHQSDFEHDRKSILKAAQAVNPEQKNLLWLCCTNGTYLHTERDVFIKRTASYNSVQFYSKEGCLEDDVRFYAIKITGEKNGVVRGNLYECDRHQYAELAAQAASPLTDETVIFQSRSCVRVPHQEFDHDKYRDLEYDYGKIVEVRHEAEDESAVLGALWREQERREKLPKSRISTHIEKLADQRIGAEADRIQGAFTNLKEPNSPHKTHYMVALSPYFLQTAGTRDMDSLLDKLVKALKNDTLHFSGITGEKGCFCFIKADPLTQERKPSIKEQLTAPPPKSDTPPAKPKDKEVR